MITAPGPLCPACSQPIAGVPCRDADGRALHDVCLRAANREGSPGFVPPPVTGIEPLEFSATPSLPAAVPATSARPEPWGNTRVSRVSEEGYASATRDQARIEIEALRHQDPPGMWRPVPGYPGIEATRGGGARSWNLPGGGGRAQTPKSLSLSKSSQYRLWRGGESKSIGLKRLIALTFPELALAATVPA